MRTRRRFQEDSPEEVKAAFISKFNYNPISGEITNTLSGRFYLKLNKKKYRQELSVGLNKVEHCVNYHRLCWFLHYNQIVPDDMQIDHINNVKDDNRIVNLRICSNQDNAKKQLLRMDNKTGYKGVSYCYDVNQQGKIYYYYTAAIGLDKKPTKIGRFKDPIEAAKFYDSAARYYFETFSKCNFEEEFIPPMSVEELRILKKQKKL